MDKGWNKKIKMQPGISSALDNLNRVTNSLPNLSRLNDAVAPFRSISETLVTPRTQVFRDAFLPTELLTSTIIDTFTASNELIDNLAFLISHMAQTSLELSEVATSTIMKLGSLMAEFNTDIISSLLQDFSHSIAKLSDVSDLSAVALDISQRYPIDDIPEEEIESLTADDYIEAAAAIADVCADPLNWEQRLSKKVKVLQEKRPVSVWIFLFLFTAFFGQLFTTAYDNIVTSKPTQLKEQPVSTSQTIIKIEQHQYITIINNVRYYFEVEFTDEETGETYTGFISKRSVGQLSPEQPPDEDDESLEQEDIAND